MLDSTPLVPESEWSGKPAKRVPMGSLLRGLDKDVEGGRPSFEANPGATWTFRCLELFQALFMWPITIYFWLLIPISIYTFVEKSIQPWSVPLSHHINVLVLPLSLSAALMAHKMVALLMKLCLLGSVKPGAYPAYKSFYCRWYLVTQMATALRGFEFIASFLGSVPGVLRLEIWWVRFFGAKLGKRSTNVLHTGALTAFELLTVGDDVFFGNNGKLFPWIERDGVLYARPITIGDGVNCGSTTYIMGGSTLAAGASTAAFSTVNGAVESTKMALDIRTMKQLNSINPGSSASENANSFPAQLKQGAMAELLTFVFGQLVLQLVMLEEDAHSYAQTIAEHVLSTGLWEGNLQLFIESVILSGVLSGLLLIALPLLAALYIIGSHWIFVPFGLEPDVLQPGTHRWHRHRITSFAYFARYEWLALSLFRGTEYEIMFYRALGATIGKRVHLDSAGIYEPYLVTIGDGCTINGPSYLSPHDLQPGATAVRTLNIGTNMTMHRWVTLHGGNRVKDSDHTRFQLAPLAQSVPLHAGAHVRISSWQM